MRITRLEIFGFKSFVERFVLNFDRNIIGVVGPNGCGKSNIVDSLRWVLGETYAKQLRGSVLDDLIFNGSETRRPLGMAEVSITIRPDPEWIKSVTQPISPSDDDREFSDGTAREGAEAVDQNGSGSLVAVNGSVHSSAPRVNGSAMASGSDSEPDSPSERDVPLPGADSIGIAVEDAVSDDGEQSMLEAGSQILREIPGLFEAAEIQFTRRLYRSGESEYFINRVPCRLRDMIDIYRLIGLGARGLSIVQQGEISQLISKKPIERRELLEEAAGISGFRTRMEAAQRKLDRTAENMGRLRDIITEVEKQVRSLARQAKRARERGELKERLEKDEIELFGLRSIRVLNQKQEFLRAQTELSKDHEQAAATLETAETLQSELQEELTGLDGSVDEQRRERDRLQAVLDAERARVEELRLNLSKVEGRISQLRTSVERLDARGLTIGHESAERRDRVEQLEKRLAELTERKRAAEAALAEVQQREEARRQAPAATDDRGDAADPALIAEIASMSEQLEMLPQIAKEISGFENELREERRKLQSAKDQANRKRVELAGVQSEVRSLESQLDALAEHVLKTTAVTGGSQRDAGVGSPDETRQVFLAGLRVPEDLQRPLAAILGDRAQYLVSSNPESLGERFVIRANEMRGKSELPKIGVIDGRNEPVPDGTDSFDKETVNSAGLAQCPLTSEELEIAPSARLVLEMLDVDPQFAAAATAVVGDFLLVDDLNQALRLNAANRQSRRPLRRMVTPSGEIIFPWGWYTTEGKGKVFSFTRRIAEQQQRGSILQAEMDQGETSVANQEQKISDVQTQLSAKQAERDRLYSVQKRLGVLNQQKQELERRRRDAILAEEKRKREVLLGEERQAQANLRTAISEVGAVQSQHNFESRKLQELVEEIPALAHQREALIADESMLTRKFTELSAQLTDTDQGENGVDSDAVIREQLGSLKLTINENETRRSQVRSALSAAGSQLSQIRRSVTDLHDRLVKSSVGLERADIELTMFREEIERLHPDAVAPTFDELTPRATPAGLPGNLNQLIATLQEESVKVRRRIEREGEVDPQSIELHEQESQRLAMMQSQLQDLEFASDMLSKTIKRLKEISRKRFLETFKSVSETFASLIPRLFGGGAGHLELINPEDPLSSGVELVVRPPGKRVSSMELLSGGEKALVAVGILISMFLHRPSPICVLDEVDAPLDEANLERYLSIIAEIAHQTQFLVITHNKRTMAAANRLIGITMQERGVSTALTVTLDEASSELEQLAANG